MLVEEDLTCRIRGCVFEVFRHLGAGFLEKVYEKALLRELALSGIRAESQVPLSVRYKDELVGEYFVDLIAEGRVLVELKAVNELSPAHEAQLINYFRASGRQVGLLVNFCQPRAIVKRFVA
jgi:GxxExxY protein